MLKVNQIQNALKEIDSAVFQKLADAYILKRSGYDKINSIGSVSGSNKTRKGTPDTYIPLPNGKYVFAEYTTQKEKISDKLNADLDKCFNKRKIGISVDKIEEIIFCFTPELNLFEEDKLRKRCAEKHINLNIFNLQTISFDLYKKYPGLAKDFLGIEIDTGQIVSLKDFKKLYNKRRLTPSISTPFHYRKEELDNTLHSLENHNLLIISGQAGVGKTRLAI